MKALEPFPQCVDCLMSLAKNAARLAAGRDTELATKAEANAQKILRNVKDMGLSSPQIANRIIRAVQHLTGVFDPYAEFKAQEMAQAQRIFSQVEDYVRSDLRSRVSLAILGNSLDFFKNPEEALAEIPKQMRDGLSVFYDDVDRLESFLGEDPGLVLYLTDNSGEIYFDLPLYDYIKKRSRRTVLVVKGGPSLNDLTRAELRLADIEDEVGEVADTGTDGAGVDWERVSKRFLDLVDSADLIVSKGMANFETIYPKELSPAILFLFKVKCEPIQDYIQAPAESFLALWRDGQ
jgi:uncharacterized protein with ATP-grasp and redox domains